MANTPIVEAGDYVGDPMDGWNIRKVADVREVDGGYTLHMEDGGVMGLDEVDPHHHYLPGEIDGYN